MMFVRHGPAWFRFAIVMLLVWSVAGCFACLQQLRLGAAAMGPPSAYDVALYARLPYWYDAVFAVSVLSGLAGAIALFRRSTLSRTLFAISLLAVVVQFGWMFAATDIVQAKGAAKVLPFPALIFAIAVFAVWLTGHARANGWIK